MRRWRRDEGEARGSGLPFLARMLLSLAVALAAVGAVQYAVVDRTLTRQAVAQLVTLHTADAEVVQRLFGAPGAGVLEAEGALDNLAVHPGVERVALLSADGTVLAVGRGDFTALDGSGGAGALDARRTVGRRVDAATARAVAAVGASGRARVTAEGGGAVVRVPVRLGGSTGVLEVLRSGDALREQVAQLRRLLLLTLAGGLALAVPVFYLLGGRSLSSRHGQVLASSSTDALTGLRNHRTFHEGLREQVAAARRTSRPLVLVLVDLDGFKQVNDTLGHRRGDAVLAAVGALLRREAPAGAAHRIGGDEFALLLPGTPAEGALALAGRVRAAVEAEVEGVTASIGVAALDATAGGAEALVEHADAALYAAKRGGRNRVVHSAALRPQPADRLRAGA